MTTIKILQGSLENLIKTLNPYVAITNSHMVGFLTENHWKNLIPNDIQIDTEEQILSCNDFLINKFFSLDLNEEQQKQSQEKTAIENFILNLQNAWDNNFKNIFLTNKQLENELLNSGHIISEFNNNKLNVTEFMTPKKNHEVEILSNLIAKICETTNYLIIDAGDGKGYLSSRLALEYELNVLGIDASDTNTNGANKRAAKLTKAWNGLTKRAEDIASGLKPPRKGRRKNFEESSLTSTPKNINYKTVTTFITPTTDFHNIIKDNFLNYLNFNEFLLSGLHTCGNLASDSLKIFVKNPNIKIITNVGCCYHLIDEHFIIDEFFNNKYDIVPDKKINPGFPMSNFLQNKVRILI